MQIKIILELDEEHVDEKDDSGLTGDAFDGLSDNLNAYGVIHTIEQVR